MNYKKNFLFGVLALSLTSVSLLFTQGSNVSANTFHTISGHVSDRAGNPIVGGFYQFMPQSGTQEPIVVTTDSNGNYSANVAPDQYKLTYGENHEPPSGFPVLVPPSDGYIDVTTGNITQDLQYDTVTLDVNFADENGNGIPQAAVTATPQGGTTTFLVGKPDVLYRNPFAGSFGIDKTTDTNGAANFTLLRGITYNVCAIDALSEINACIIYTPTQDMSSISLTAPVFHTISGHVSDRAGNPIVGGFYEFISDSAIPDPVLVETDSNGYYSANVVPGQYRLTYGQNHNPPDGFPILTPSTGQNYIDATNGNMVQDFRYDTVALNINFIDQDGNAIPQADISATPKGGETTFPLGNDDVLYKNPFAGSFGIDKTTDADGVASFIVLRGLEYNVCAVDPISLTNSCIIYIPSSDTSSVTLSAPVFHTISGHVSDRAGNPIVGAYYQFVAQSGSQEPVLVETDGNGDYSANVVPDQYKLRYGDNHNPPSDFPVLVPLSDDYIDATDSNVTQNLQYDSVSLGVDFIDQNGNDIPLAAVSVTPQGGTTTFLAGRPDVLYRNPFAGSFGIDRTTDTNGTASFTVLRGLEYNVCAIDPISVVQYCVLYTPTNDLSSVVIGGTPKGPDAPIGLTAQSPTNQLPLLSWEAVSGADHYEVYRDGSVIGSSLSPEFTDSTVTNGSHDYYVMSVSSNNISSVPSNTISVTYDAINPNITHSLAPLANPNGWHNSAVTVAFNCDDSLTLILSCTSPVTVSNEGASQEVIGTTEDSAGNTAVDTVHLSIDKTPPILSTPTWTNNPLTQGLSTSLSVKASDVLSGASSVNYSIAGSSPQLMTYVSASDTWQATFGNTLVAGTYMIEVTAVDNAGNNTIYTDILAVYNPSNGYVTGHGGMYPTSSDTLPIALDASNNPAKLVIGFSSNGGDLTSTSFDIDYTVKNKKNQFTVNSTNTDWVVVQDSEHASIQGTADLTKWVNGVASTTQGMKLLFNITLGTNGAPDRVLVKIYNPGANTSTATPVYVIDDAIIASGSNLRIHL